MTAKRILLASLAAATALGPAAAPALAKDSQPASRLSSSDCFRSRDWENSRAADDNTLYIGVRLHDVYRIKVLGGARWIGSPSYYIVSIIRGGSDMICAPIDLDLKIADRSTGIVMPLMATEISKLTPEEIQALPKKQLPIAYRRATPAG